MSTRKARKARNRRTGRYTFDGGLSRLCAVCGQRLGVHDGEAPHPAADFTLIERECPGFKPAKKPADRPLL